VRGAAGFGHRVSEFLEIVKAQTLPDYPAVLLAAEMSHAAGARRWLTTLNAAVMRKIFRSAEFPYGNDEYFCIDGVPIGKILRSVLPSNVRRVTGTDLVPYLCENLPSHLGSIVFVGEREDIARASIDVLSTKYARSDLLHVPIPEGWKPGDPIMDAEREVLSSVKPGVVFVCLSFPKTRQWFEERHEVLPIGLYVGVGSALRAGGGHLKRLPRALRDRGFEWVGRLFQDPLRLGPRYAADFFFLARLAFEISRPSFRRARTVNP
jgi:N-acetylglucosaminyldiphosphoundecaprenol N-acetyl-beta-D-mannosaminyltransferase